MATIQCYECDAELPQRGAYKRPRLCQRCTVARRLAKRRATPAARLHHKLANNLPHRWIGLDKAVYSREAVQRVLDRWGVQSVISGQDDVALLCITPYKHDAPPTEADLIVVTTQEAQRISKLSLEDVQELLPARIWERLTGGRP